MPADGAAVVAGNWKMNPARPPTRRSPGARCARRSAAVPGRRRSSSARRRSGWPTSRRAAGQRRIGVGAQTMHAEERGAFTGETRPLMLGRARRST